MADGEYGMQTTGRPRLQGALPSGQNVDFELGKDLVLIGRSQECDLVLDHPGVSRHHAQIRGDGRTWVVEDLGSANGLLLNGGKVRSGILDDAAVLKLGPVELRFVPGSPAPVDDDKTVFQRLDAPAPRGRVAEPVSSGSPRRLIPIQPRRLVLIIAVAVLLLLMMLALCGREDTVPTPEQVTKTEQDSVPEPGQPPAKDTPSVSSEPQEAARTDAGPPSDVFREARALAVEHGEGAQLSFDAGRLPDAVRDWRLALELDPDNEIYRIKLKSALELLDAQAEEAYRNGARHYQFLRYDEAIREWNRVLHLIPDPDHPLHQNAQRNLEQARLQKQH